MAHYTHSQLNIALTRYQEVSGQANLAHRFLLPSFDAWIGSPISEMPYTRKLSVKPTLSYFMYFYECPEDVSVKINLLLSPHYKALYKAHQIKHGGNAASKEVIQNPG